MNKLYEENAVQDIANAIREKNGLATLYKIGEMGQAIREIKTGASGLNVIRSATKPASATENTVWLETDVQAGALTVSSVEPANPVDGDVWIVPHNTRPMELPIFEGINLSMGVARLRAANAWSFIDFAGFVDNAWKDSHTPLFKDGAWGGVLDNGEGVKYSWEGAGWAQTPTLNISDGVLTASATSERLTGGGGFTVLGTPQNIAIDEYFWQSATIKLGENVTDAYLGIFPDDHSYGTPQLEGKQILQSEAAAMTNFRDEISLIGLSHPAILVRRTLTTVRVVDVGISDWFLV